MQGYKYLQIPFAFSKLVVGRRWERATINITCVFNAFHFPTSNFIPKFLFQIGGRKTSSTIISTSENLVCHFLIITECIIPEKNYSYSYPWEYEMQHNKNTWTYKDLSVTELTLTSYKFSGHFRVDLFDMSTVMGHQTLPKTTKTLYILNLGHTQISVQYFTL